MPKPKLKPLIAGNWKMNGLRSAAKDLRQIANQLVKPPKAKADVLICPPAQLLWPFKEVVRGTPVRLGAQDCHVNVSGAHTGDISASMMADIGARAIIVGHSERRTDHGERNALVHQKAEAALGAGLMAIICVGETEAERDAGMAIRVISKQLKESVPAASTSKNTVVAYEPVWAIGTGRTPTSDDIQKAHKALRTRLQKRFGADGDRFRLLYGGSVKPANAVEILSIENVNGALVGGASLKAADFVPIVRAAG